LKILKLKSRTETRQFDKQINQFQKTEKITVADQTIDSTQKMVNWNFVNDSEFFRIPINWTVENITQESKIDSSQLSDQINQSQNNNNRYEQLI